MAIRSYDAYLDEQVTRKPSIVADPRVYRTRTALSGTENADCAVRAVMVACCIDYDAAHRLFDAAGRVPRQATPWAITVRVAEQAAGPIVVESTYDNSQLHRPTLKQWLAKHPVGHYIVRNGRHAFAVCDGVLHDWRSTTGPRTRVYGSIRVA
jgi:hypothetical protein